MPTLRLLITRLFALVALLATLVPAQVVVAQGTQTTAQTWEVQAGAIADEGRFEALAFFPDPLTIRAGDTVRWTIMGFHTVTFNANQPPLPLFVPGPNPGDLSFGPGAFPTGPMGPNPTYDGTTRANSGVPLQEGGPGSAPPTYRLTFTRPGVYGYVCLVHPGMNGTIQVQPASEPLPETAAQARTRGEVTRNALLGQIRLDVQEVKTPSMGSVHIAHSGHGNGFQGNANIFPGGTRTVRRGDTVIWIQPYDFELHTVTFVADPNAPPPASLEIRVEPQAAGPPRVTFPNEFVNGLGGPTVTGPGIYHSGMLGWPIENYHYALRFDAPGTYNYLCAIHGPIMSGTITVTD